MISDFHNDILTSEDGCIAELSASVKCAVCAVYRDNKNFDGIFPLVENFLRKKIDNLYLGLEDIGYVNDENIDRILEWKPVYASLTWNYKNDLAGGCYVDEGISLLGKRVVETLSGAGIAIDSAHLSKRSFYDLLDSRAEIVNSHTCLNQYNEHTRNIDMWQVNEIVLRGGLVGITLVADFYGQGICEESVFEQIDGIVQRHGADCVCIGTDFFGTNRFAAGLSSYAKLENLHNIFYLHGYSKIDADKIFVKNLQNYLSKKRDGIK